MWIFQSYSFGHLESVMLTFLSTLYVVFVDFYDKHTFINNCFVSLEGFLGVPFFATYSLPTRTSQWIFKVFQFFWKQQFCCFVVYVKNRLKFNVKNKSDFQKTYFKNIIKKVKLTVWHWNSFSSQSFLLILTVCKNNSFVNKASDAELLLKVGRFLSPTYFK